MLKNYFLTTLRKIKRNFGLHLLNIAGLSIGLAISFLIFLYLIHETGFDKQHKKRNHIYRLILNYHPEGSESNYIVSDIENNVILKLREEYPEVKKITNIYRIDGNNYIRYRSKFNPENDICFADPEVLDIFTFDLIKGEDNNLLIDDFDVLITESKSKKYFQNENPIGKLLTLETEKDTILLTVKGIIKDFPINSTFKFDFIGKMSNSFKDYYNNFFPEETYLLVQYNTHQEELEKKLPVFKYEYETTMINSYTIQSLNDIYFYSDFIQTYDKKTGNKTNVYILGVIAVVILLVSINNYIIFSIFDTKSLIKEIAIRKTAGASLKNIQIQQLISSFIFAFIAFIIAFIIMYLLIPSWNNYFEVNLYPILLNNINYTFGIIIITFLTGLMSGLYNAFYISVLNPLLLFRSSFISIKRKNYLQKIIIAFQVLLFVSLTSFSILVKNQVNFAINKDTGYDKENILIIDFSNKELKDKYQVFKNEISNLPFVSDVSALSQIIPNNNLWKTHLPKYNEQSKNVIAYSIKVDENFFNTMSIPLINGNDEQKAFTDKKAYIINEIAAKELGINKDLKFPVNLLTKDGKTIIIERICMNFDLQSVNHQPFPLVIRMKESHLNNVLIKLDSNKPDNALKQIESLYYGIVSNDFTFQAVYLDDHIENSYSKNRLFLYAISLGTLITIFMAILGLLNVSLLILKSRTKEILVRKVHGASKLSIVKLLAAEEAQLVIGANIIAIPFTIYLMNKWLQNFAQHINITSNIFIISLTLSVIFMLAISFISLKIIFRKNLLSELNRE
ncbi:ABC transporter permease [Bacteroidota bacterium]